MPPLLFVLFIITSYTSTSYFILIINYTVLALLIIGFCDILLVAQPSLLLSIVIKTENNYTRRHCINYKIALQQ